MGPVRYAGVGCCVAVVLVLCFSYSDGYYILGYGYSEAIHALDVD